MRNSGMRAAAALLLALSASGCERARRPADVPGADALTGEWSAELVVTQPLAGRTLAAPAPAARGTLSLLRDGRARRVPGLTGPPTHVGARTVRLRPLGFEPRPPGGVPGVAARWIAPDSVEMAFESATPDELFVIRGRMEGDSIAGRWHYGSRGAGGSFGRVVLRRGASARAAETLP